MTLHHPADRPLRVLVVEDEALICMTLHDVLEDLGCEIAATCTSLQQAMQSATHAEFDVAILDVNLAGEEITPVSDTLHNRSIPFIFSTGYGKHGVPKQFGGYPVMEKPFSDTDVETALKAALGNIRKQQEAKSA